MTKQELFKKYNINETHNHWDKSIDSWFSVEIYRLMNNGNLPIDDNESPQWILDFLDKAQDDLQWWVNNVMKRPNWGSFYLTAKRMVYRYQEQFITP